MSGPESESSAVVPPVAGGHGGDHLQIIRIPIRVGDRWALSGRYVEVVWSEIMGPTATLLARRLSDFIEVNPNGGEISIAGLGRTLGVPPSKVRSALSRMGWHGLISLRPERVSVGISGLVPSVGHSRLAELSENAQREHR